MEHTQVFSILDMKKVSQQIILHSQADTGDFPENTNTRFKNNLHSTLRQKSGSCPQIQLVGIYSTVSLSRIHIQVEGIKSYFFGSIHKGQHKRLHIGSASVEKDQYWEVKNSSYFDVDLSNLDSWSISIQDRNGVEIKPQQGASTVIEMSIVMNPTAEAPKYLYFGSEPLSFPSFLNIKPKCYASLLSFSHDCLANIFPPHNEMLIKQNCNKSDNDISCTQTNILIPTDFYTLEKLVFWLNSTTLKYGIAFESEEGRLKIARNSIGSTQLRLPKKLAELFGCKTEVGDKYRLIGSESTFNLFDPLLTIPPVIALKCSLLDKNGLSMVQQCLRLIYINSKKGGASYDFDHKQPCLMTCGYFDTVSFRMETFPNNSPVYFAPNSQYHFSGCLEIQHTAEI